MAAGADVTYTIYVVTAAFANRNQLVSSKVVDCSNPDVCYKRTCSYVGLCDVLLSV